MLTTILATALLATAPADGALASAPSPADVLGQLEQAHRALFDRIAPGVVFLRTRDGFGSGFFVSERGHILTNRHVVAGTDVVDVVAFDGTKYRGSVVDRGEHDLDLAIVKIDARDTHALTIGSSRNVDVGTWVGSVGHGRGGIWTLSTGAVSNAYGDADEGVLQTQIPLNPGASGGPVFDRHGRVVAVVTAGIADAQAMNFAIRTDTAVAGLPYLRSLTDCLVVDAPAGAKVFVDGVLFGTRREHALLLRPGRHEVTAVVRGRRLRRTVDFPADRRVSFADTTVTSKRSPRR